MLKVGNYQLLIKSQDFNSTAKMSKLNEKILEFRDDIGQSIEGLALLMQMDPEEYTRLEKDWIPPDDILRRLCLSGIIRKSNDLQTILPPREAAKLSRQISSLLQ
jgi:hypothetical protein